MRQQDELFQLLQDTSESDAMDIRLVAGMDISFVKDSDQHACASLVVLTYPQLNLVYESHRYTSMDLPYIPGYLAFREAPVLLDLLNDLKQSHPEFMPDVVLLDGNGILHPKGFGLACHVGVLSNLPTIGVAKNLFLIDGLVKSCETGKDSRFEFLIGNSGKTWGAAVWSSKRIKKPIYVSIGHRISLSKAIEIVLACCRYRIPQPIRQADLKSREIVRDWKKQQVDCNFTIQKLVKDLPS